MSSPWARQSRTHRSLNKDAPFHRATERFTTDTGWASPPISQNLVFGTHSDTVYAIDSESGPYNHGNWRNGVRIGPVDEDRVTGFIPPFERSDRVYQGAAGEGVAVDAEGNVYAAEGPNSFVQAGGAFSKYSVGR